ncbi:hypothetical protein NLI96_g7463 [Meripilus lineatus]|uniref:Major facilitator superfamily (MFS) profile domain-containing protein n=1 Tax=Meripilus lineatus TaxID=2056292 RepID=A0AAD5YH61_9APHY|nr:hypothetical protein NLI96_g7463 [Physisporinus lineatus]
MSQNITKSPSLHSQDVEASSTNDSHGALKLANGEADSEPVEKVQAKEDHHKEQTSSDPAPGEPPYSAFSTREKWVIVGLASFGGLFSPFTANIYFPAIPSMSEAFNKSIELINLTVTMYMLFQGIAPLFWGTLADKWGRRPIFLACLLVLALSCVGIALQSTKDYWLLMVLRCIQASGSASTIALGAGVIADIATRAERGGFFGVYTLGPMVKSFLEPSPNLSLTLVRSQLGPCIGPIIGGALAQNLGAIFWFLCISSAICFIIMFLIFPETLRALVGDGSIPPPRIYRPPIPVIGRIIPIPNNQERPPHKTLQNPLRIFLNLDVCLLLLYNSVINSIFYGIIASISSLFNEVYPYLSETDLGLVFLAYGGGMLIGSIATGKILDKEYQRIKQKMIRKAERDAHLPGAIKPEDVTADENFPIELARFRVMPFFLALFVIACIGYGWCLQTRVNIAAPLILHIILGFTTMAILNSTQTLLVDLLPNQGSSITACNNFTRCGLGAVVVSVIDLMVRSVGMGWTYVILGAMGIAVSPITFILIRLGPKCRAQRRARAAQ